MREMHRHSSHNLVDLAGYAKVTDMVEKAKITRQRPLTIDSKYVKKD